MSSPSDGPDPQGDRPEEELCAWTLAHGAGPARIPADATSRERARLADLEADLQRIRAVLEPRALDELASEARSSPAQSTRARELAQRVLARTTREDPSWRGDARLVLRFCRQRLGSSVVLKLAAASLLVHLVAVPVLGYYVLRPADPPAGTIVRFEPPPAELPFGDRPAEEEHPVRFLAPGEEPPAPLPFPTDQ